MIRILREYIERRRKRKIAWKQMHYWKNKRDGVLADMKAIVRMYPKAINDMSSLAWKAFVIKCEEHDKLEKLADHYEQEYNKL